MDDTLLQLGARLRAQRSQLGLTLAQVAEAAGFSTGYISQIERDLCTPSLSALRVLADVLQVPIAELLAQEDELSLDQQDSQACHTAVGVVRRNQRKKLIYPDGNIAHELITPRMLGSFEFLWAEIPPGGSNRDELYSHPGGGTECGIVLEGSVEILIGDEVFTLGEGDSIAYDASLPHRWRNIGDVDAHTVWVISPPDF